MFVLLVVAGFSPRSLAVRENSTNAAKARDYILRHAQFMHMFQAFRTLLTCF